VTLLVKENCDFCKGLEHLSIPTLVVVPHPLTGQLHIKLSDGKLAPLEVKLEGLPTLIDTLLDGSVHAYSGRSLVLEKLTEKGVHHGID
jgi:hypothetical protein